MKTYWRLLSFGKPYHHYVPQYVVFIVLSIVFGLLNLTLLKPLFDVIFEQMSPDELAIYRAVPAGGFSLDSLKHLFYHYLLQAVDTYGAFGSLMYVCGIIVVSVFLANLFAYLAGMQLAKLKARVVRNLRLGVYDKISRLHIGFFTNERKGDTLSRLTNDVQEVENSIASSMKVVFRDPIMVIIYFVTLFIWSYQLTLFSLIILPVLGGVISEIVRRLKKKAIQSQESLGRLVNIIDETLGGMRIIKAFTARSYVNEKFKEEADTYRRISVSMARKNELAPPTSQFLGVLVVSVLLVYGGKLVLDQQTNLDGSSFFTYLIIYTQIIPPLKEISKALSNIQRGIAAGNRIFSIADTEPVIQDPANPQPLTDFEQAVTFEQVGFSYDTEPVLQGIDLTIKKGKTVALVGPSGGGKSTLADLVPRFYDPTQGQVLIDGQPLTAFRAEDVRRLMGIVTQESILFNDSIRSNIAFGKPEATDAEVEQAAKIANAHDFIMQTAEGYDTIIGERGSKLSGGQRQRLSIARAVLKNPPILILDEATSALDSESERLVQDALTKLMQDRTSLVIAHRLSTIQHADEIVVLQKGQIIERGTHNELMAQNGVYTKLNRMQAL